jgi:hypothetical protein
MPANAQGVPTSRSSSSKRRRPRTPSIPKTLRLELTQFVRSIGRKYGAEFKSDRQLKVLALRLMAALMPPRPRRRGRPRNPEITRAIMLHGRFRRLHPEEKPCALWDRVCRVVCFEYATLSKVEQDDIRDALRDRVKSRRRSRRVRKSR